MTDAEIPPPASEPDDIEDAAEPTGRRRRRVSPAVRAVAYTILAVLVLSSGGVASWLYFKQYRPDQQTDFGARQAVISSASDGTTALLSYSSETLDQDFASAKKYLAGDFLDYYNDLSQRVVAPAARQQSLKTTAHVTGAAVTEMRPDSAVVLIFLDQTTTIKDNPQPAVALNTALVHMTRVNGNWLIAKFNPI